MTMKRLLQGLIIAVAFCLSATVGLAQDSLVFVTGGVSSIRDARAFYLDYIPFETRYANGGGGNVGIEVPLKKSKIFGLELSYGYSQNNLELTNYNNINATTTVSYGLRGNRASGDLVVHSPSTFRDIRPYFVLGAEYDRYSPSSSATTLGNTVGFGIASVAKLSSEGNGGVNIGGGLDYKVTEKWGVRLDVRDHITSSPTLGLPYGITPTSNAYFPISGDSHFIEYTIGIVYHFGRKQASSPRQPSKEKPSKEKPSKDKPAKEKPSPTEPF